MIAMKQGKNFFLPLLLIFGLITFCFAREWKSIHSSVPKEMKVSVLESTMNSSKLHLETPGFYTRLVEINGSDYIEVFHPDAPAFLQKGFPGLPRINTTIVIPEHGSVEVSVLDAEYQEFHLGPIAPSKGSLLRTQVLNQIPYEFDSFYTTDSWFPEENVQLSDPFILRDFRGVHVQFQPFQYNPSSHTVRVATQLTVSVNSRTGKGVNEKTRRSLDFIHHDFRDLYQRVFANFNTVESTLSLEIDEPGNLVILTYDRFANAIDPLRLWKIQKGIPTKLVSLSEIGSSSSEIKQYLKSLYNRGQLTHVILVGDAEQIPVVFGISGAASDPTYVMLEGDDYYPDVFISRISASTVNQAKSQVEKFISYEKEPSGGDWYQKATFVASNEGGNEPPDYLTDWERAEILRDMLLDYTYMEVDQIYDPDASHAGLVEVLNNGRSFLNYLGHGTGYSWRTTRFDSSDAYSLTNFETLPFIIDVSSFNGQWHGKTCLAETFLRNPSGGAIGMFSSSVSPWWIPPTVMQKHVIELLVTEQRYTMGGLTLYGAIHALEAYNGNFEGIAVVEEYNLFGDCTLPLRTMTPVPLDVIHDSAVPLDSKHITVSSYYPGAMVGLSKKNRLYGSGIIDETGFARIEFLENLEKPDTLILTVTAQNAIPYISSVTFSQPLSSFIAFNSFLINDTSGNNDGSVDFGETVGMRLWASNLGRLDAENVHAKVSTPDSNITWTKKTLSFGDINSADVLESTDEIVFSVSTHVTNGHVIPFKIEFMGKTKKGKEFLFIDYFQVVVEAPVLRLVNRSFISRSILTAGETAELFITLINEGAEEGVNVEVKLRELSDYVKIENEVTNFSSITPNGGLDSNTANPFLITTSENTPVGSEVLFELQIKTQQNYQASASFIEVVGENIFVGVDTPQEFGIKNAISIVNIPVAITLSDLDVQVDISHTYVEDIELNLESPSGTVITLVSRIGGSGNDFNHTIFDDDSKLSITHGWPPFLGSYRPIQPLRTFNGENTSGVWKLYVIDHQSSIDDGVLNSWKLTVKSEGATTPCSKGDVNQDGVVNLFDIIDAVKIIIERRENISAFELCAADYDNDGDIKIFDIVSMVNIILGIDLSIESPTGDVALIQQPETIMIESEDLLGGLFLIIETDEDITLHDTPGIDMFYQNSGKEVALLLVNSGDITMSGKKLFSINSEYKIKDVEVADRQGNQIDVNITSIPGKYAVYQNYPNPFNSVTSIPFDLCDGGNVNFIIYNLSGQKVRTLINGKKMAGFHEVMWSGKDDLGNPVATGVYLYQLSVNGFIQTRKMIFLE